MRGWAAAAALALLLAVGAWQDVSLHQEVSRLRSQVTTKTTVASFPTLSMPPAPLGRVFQDEQVIRNLVAEVTCLTQHPFGTYCQGENGF